MRVSTLEWFFAKVKPNVINIATGNLDWQTRIAADPQTLSKVS